MTPHDFNLEPPALPDDIDFTELFTGARISEDLAILLDELVCFPSADNAQRLAYLLIREFKIDELSEAQ